MPKPRCYDVSIVSRNHDRRRPWALTIWLVAIALQIMQPISIVRAMAAMLDPLDHPALCTATPDDPGTGKTSGGAPAQSHTICPVCQAAGTIALALAVADSGASPRPALAAIIVSDPAQSVGPRGPPLLRPPVRAPPPLS